MAIWQFAFSIIPDKVVSGINSKTQPDTKLSGSDDSWSGYCLSESSLEKISKSLTQTKSWSDNIRQFGHLDETCIELFYEKDTLLDVSIRLDLRNLTTHILETVIDFIKDNKALILTPKGILITPVLEDIVSEIKKSDAKSYIKNSQEFLASLNR